MGKPTNKPRFHFGQTVIVEGDQIGLICKTWGNLNQNFFQYDVYVRTYNNIHEYNENEITQYIYSKTLTKEELEFYV